MSALAAFNFMLPFAVAGLGVYLFIRFALVILRLVLIVLLFTALGSGLVYTPGYQAVIHLITGSL